LVAGGLLPWAGEIVGLTLGKAYAGSEATLVLMFLFSVPQSMGQIGGSLLCATGYTRPYATLGLANMALGLIVAYFMMAPSNAVVPGLALMSRGLAYKMVLMQLVFANFQDWLIARLFGWKYEWSYQVVGTAIAIATGWLVKVLVSMLTGVHVMFMMTAAVPIYLALMAGALYLMPWVAGTNRKELEGFIRGFVHGRAS
jgi:O-antigen/teichoic acid export membrane protein